MGNTLADTPEKQQGKCSTSKVKSKSRGKKPVAETLDDPLYQIYPNSYQQNTINQDQILGNVPGDGSANNVITFNSITPTRNPLYPAAVQENHADQDDYTKKKIHRDIERQRRQEMAAQFVSLRSLLPYEYIKGKRSMSDQINGASNYIKDMQKRVNELAGKRDQLKKLSFKTESSSNSAQSSLVTKLHEDSLEIIYKTCIEQDFHLSKVVDVLLKEGHEIVNLVSARVGSNFVHTIKSQVGDSTDVDLSRLQQKIVDAVPSLMPW